VSTAGQRTAHPHACCSAFRTPGGRLPLKMRPVTQATQLSWLIVSFGSINLGLSRFKVSLAVQISWWVRLGLGWIISR